MTNEFLKQMIEQDIEEQRQREKDKEANRDSKLRWWWPVSESKTVFIMYPAKFVGFKKDSKWGVQYRTGVPAVILQANKDSGENDITDWKDKIAIIELPNMVKTALYKTISAAQSASDYEEPKNALWDGTENVNPIIMSITGKGTDKTYTFNIASKPASKEHFEYAKSVIDSIEFTEELFFEQLGRIPNNFCYSATMSEDEIVAARVQNQGVKETPIESTVEESLDSEDIY